jgi:hypothetical protein
LANGFIYPRGNIEVENVVGNEVWNELYARSFFKKLKPIKRVMLLSKCMIYFMIWLNLLWEKNVWLLGLQA